jgi:hypothetical protein
MDGGNFCPTAPRRGEQKNVEKFEGKSITALWPDKSGTINNIHTEKLNFSPLSTALESVH